MYGITVELDRLICRDTESLHSADRFALFGTVYTDDDATGFVLPVIRINSNQNVRIPDDYRMIFDHQFSRPEFTLVLFGYDLDENQAWIENREDIIKVSSIIAQAVKLIPKVGAAIGKVLDEVNATVPPIIDQFVAWDKADKLLDHQALHKVPLVGVNNPVWQPLTIDFKREDLLGYSSWDYSLKLNIKGTAIGSFGPSKPGEAHLVPRKNTTPEAWLGTWEGPSLRADISRSDESDALRIHLLDKTTGATMSQSGVKINTFEGFPVPVKEKPDGPTFQPGPAPFPKPDGTITTPTFTGDGGDYLALTYKITLEYHGVEGDLQALRPALHFRQPTILPLFDGSAPENRRDEFLSLSLNIG